MSSAQDTFSLFTYKPSESTRNVQEKPERRTCGWIKIIICGSEEGIRDDKISHLSVRQVQRELKAFLFLYKKKNTQIAFFLFLQYAKSG